MRRRWRLVAAGLALAIGLALLVPPLLTRAIGSRVRAEAARRGLDVTWRSLEVRLPARALLRDPIARASGDTVFQARSLAVALDPLALLLGRTQVSGIEVAHATARLPASHGVDPDTLAPDEPARGRPGDAERALRVRRSAEGVARLVSMPARRLPRLTFDDVTVRSSRGADALWSGVHIAWLGVEPSQGGVRLAASGSILGEREVPFVASLVHAHDDRLSGAIRLEIPDTRGRRTALVLGANGIVRQDRRQGRLVIADGSRFTIGKLPLIVRATIARQGPTLDLTLAARGLTAEQVQGSLPEAVLGPLAKLKVRGSWDYKLALDLDGARPDSVRLAASVVPHGLALDWERSRLDLALEQPFVARIHLPRGREVERELSEANPHFRPLERIASPLVTAVVTNEDGAFFRHRGFNLEAVEGAIADDLRSGSFRRGAGTITMQLVRNLYLGHERTLSRKFQEVVLAWVLEHLTGITKERLLEIYLNIIEWGPNVHGADEAARFYFDRDASEVTVEQALFLATVVPAPSKWRSRFDATGALRPFARAQMHFIGRAMVAKGWLPAESLVSTDSLKVELAGAARAVLFPPDTTGPDTTGPVHDSRLPG
ncbi:MAG: hypothetical protein E6K78_03285 [Candidatus Eisenbacteria bacterium]|uniref:Glycosyl transferase family 51 domain-containing protein n=1 Tax=Eiseniibacteriota bacterium TaxID=2212470 RepID=A0A538TW83_UNCEI|nr:MAG: hypothetical protein E6K78_03285 [Candidatus Eisenbacteria bacterium]